MLDKGLGNSDACVPLKLSASVADVEQDVERDILAGSANKAGPGDDNPLNKGNTVDRAISKQSITIDANDAIPSSVDNELELGSHPKARKRCWSHQMWQHLPPPLEVSTER